MGEKGTNGRMEGGAYARAFVAWRRQVEDFQPNIRQGTLNITKVADECGFPHPVRIPLVVIARSSKLLKTSVSRVTGPDVYRPSAEIRWRMPNTRNRLSAASQVRHAKDSSDRDLSFEVRSGGWLLYPGSCHTTMRASID